jgi:hypothetical protein
VLRCGYSAGRWNIFSLLTLWTPELYHKSAVCAERGLALHAKLNLRNQALSLIDSEFGQVQVNECNRDFSANYEPTASMQNSTLYLDMLG